MTKSALKIPEDLPRRPTVEEAERDRDARIDENEAIAEEVYEDKMNDFLADVSDAEIEDGCSSEDDFYFDVGEHVLFVCTRSCEFMVCSASWFSGGWKC